MPRKPSKPPPWFPTGDFYTDELCSRCGVCCGSTDGHPCEYLRKAENGQYFCEVYKERFGQHQTTDGHAFICVPIRFVIENTGGYGCCTYVQEIKRRRETMGQATGDLGKKNEP